MDFLNHEAEYIEDHNTLVFLKEKLEEFHSEELKELREFNLENQIGSKIQKEPENSNVILLFI